MAQYGNKGPKNPPWARADQGGMGISNQMQQSMMNANLAAALPNAAMLQYPQQQVFAGQIGYQQQQIYNNLGTVQYPTRALNSAAFQNAASPGVQNNQNRSGESSKERVITGTVTKLHDNFGFVDDDIFFQLSCVTNGANNLRIGSRVLVEATFNSSMPFKWNAQRIQVLPTNANQNQQQRADGNTGDRFGGNRYGNRNMQQQNKNKLPQQQAMQGRRPMDRNRDRSPSVDSDRKRRKNERRRTPSRDRRTRSRTRSPARKKRRPYVPRYNVQIPKFTLNNFENDVSELKRKFTNMYIPSDFFLSRSSWQRSFPLDKPFNLDAPCKFHVFSKDVVPLKKTIPEPADIDYLYCAKVILLASPGLEELFKKCITLAEDSSRSQSRSPEDDLTMPAKLLSVLIGQRGKEPMAIGGPWSPSMDGEDPESDPGVLIKTAIRSTKYQTGIDLSNCTHWFRFLEIHYSRAESVIKGKTVPARVETVVLFIPDVWSCVATRPEWDELGRAYAKQLQRQLTNTSPADDPDEKKEDEEEDEKEDEGGDANKKEPTHYSELDPKNMKVSDLRDELEARGLSLKGLKSQLVARLSKAIKTEADAEEQKENEGDKDRMSDDELDYDDKPDEDENEKEKEDEKEKEEEKKEIDEKEKARMERLYKIPESPQILVHPNPEIKSGKFNCAVYSLHSLLNYRVEDNKEHSFELFLFAEMFNAMLVRDFSIHIYRAICNYAEKPKDESKEKDDKDKKKEKTKENKEKDEKKMDKDKKEDEEKKEEEEDKDDKDSVHSKDKKDDKKKEKVKLKTVDPYLLLSFAYFDSTLCGYIVDRDVEDLLSNLCLSLSRAQVKRLVQKVVTKDALHYRRLTDKSKEEIEESLLESQETKEIDQSNRHMLPSFGGESSKACAEKLESGFVNYNGSLIDVGKLMKQLERNEASRLSTEKLYNRLLEENNSLKNNYETSTKSNKELSYELNTFKKRLSSSTNDLDMMSARVMRYVDVIFQIKKNIDPIIKENTPEEDFKPAKMEAKQEPDSTLKRDKLKEKDFKFEKKDGDIKKDFDKSSKRDDSKAKEQERKGDDKSKTGEKAEERFKDKDKESIDKSKDSVDKTDVKIRSEDSIEIKDGSDCELKSTDRDMEVDDVGHTDQDPNDKEEVDEDEKTDDGTKPEPKRKAALGLKDEPGRRTPVKRDVKKPTPATPATPKRKRI